MDIPTNLKYTREHEWVKVEGAVATVGITDHAQHALGDITFVELPKTGAAVTQFNAMATIESVKAASDIYAPVSGTVKETNARLETEPGLVNQAPYDQAWIAKIAFAKPDEIKNLMDAAAYGAYLKESEGK
ncbi:MAG: glycine cleavage system protein GcvH [Deltaproteobacteria bacterium]